MLFPFGLAIGFLLAAAPVAGAEFPQTGHCTSAEVTLFQSRMGTSVWNDMRTRKRLKGDKILSLCADRFPAPRKLLVRFGKLGAPELIVSSPDVGYRLSSQAIDAGESWTILSFDHQGLNWSIVQPEGGNARDVFLVVSRDGVALQRTEAIDEGEHWLLYKKKFGKKKIREVPAMLSDLPPALVPRARYVLDPAKVMNARYAANLSLTK